MRRRSLSDEERALWTGFARSITPLRRALVSPEPSPSAVRENSPAPPRPAPRQDIPPAKAPPLAPFERRLRQRVARGREPIEARIDLHGMTQRQAHAALFGFLQRSQAEGARIVLVVTGKGGEARAGGDPRGERGVLKRQVPVWLELPQFRAFVLGFEDAHAGHGGQGALYVRLRRGR